MNNIILIGMPGAGKSTVGVILAKTLGMTFIDTDLLIQDTEKELLQNIIDKKGINEFNKIEEKTILNIDVKNSIISTGGSVVLSLNSMVKLKSLGKVIYLQVDYNEINKRVNNITTRGIVKRDEQSLYDVFMERTPLYEKYADKTIYCNNLNVEQIIQKIKGI